jgi:hypothetical protein
VLLNPDVAAAGAAGALEGRSIGDSVTISFDRPTSSSETEADTSNWYALCNIDNGEALAALGSSPWNPVDVGVRPLGKNESPPLEQAWQQAWDFHLYRGVLRCFNAAGGLRLWSNPPTTMGVRTGGISPQPYEMAWSLDPVTPGSNAYYLVHNSGLVLGAPNAGGNVVLEKRDGTRSQQWKIEDLPWNAVGAGPQHAPGDD